MTKMLNQLKQWAKSSKADLNTVKNKQYWSGYNYALDELIKYIGQLKEQK